MGAGRKSIAEEYKTRKLCIAAIEKRHGSLEKGLIYLLDSDNPVLIKFVFEHAVGKPVENHDITTRGEPITCIRLLDIDGTEI